MNERNCEAMADRLPLHVRGELTEGEAEAVTAHLATCADCRAELEVVGWLIEAGPAPAPGGLAAQVRAALRAESASANPGVRRRAPLWGLAAAAGIVLALAAPSLIERVLERPPVTLDELQMAEGVSARLPSPWLDAGGIAAGTLVLDGLSDEALEQLLEEMGG